jgi:hypothetical protein
MELQAVIERELSTRASATLDGHAFDIKALVAAQDELDAITGASGELTRRDRSKTAKAAAAARLALAQRVIPIIDTFLAAIDDQEAAARAMVAASSQANAARAEIETACRGLGISISLYLMRETQEERRSLALMALLQSHLGKSHFGQMRLDAGAIDASEAWSKAERGATQDILTIIKETAQ